MDAYVNTVVRHLIAQSWQIALLAIAVAMVTLALRRRSAHVRYLLWLIVVAKCLVPPLHTVPLRVLPPPTHGEAMSAPSTPSGTNESLTAPSPTPPSVAPAVAQGPAPLPAIAQGPAYRFSASDGLAMLWIAGAACYLMMNMLRVVRGHRRLRATRQSLPEEARTDVEGLLPAFGLRRLPRIWVVEGVGQPFVWGLLRGSIYVPPTFFLIESAEHRRDILAHEFSHVLRFDVAVNTLQVLAQGLFWFHPFVWWTNLRIRREREKCCDEMVIARLHTTPKDYSTAIVETLARAKGAARPIPSLAVAGPLKHIEERIRTMLTPGRRFHQRPSAMAAVLVVLAAVLAIPTALVLTARATAEDRAVADVLAKYEAARKTVPGRYLMLVRSERELCVTWQDGTRFYFARYLFGGPSRAGREDYHPDDLMGVVAEARASAGETIASMLAWANRQIPERVDMGDETRGCGFTSDGFGHLREDKYRFPRLDLPGTSSPILQGLGWPEIASSGRACRLVSDDRYAVDNNLICVERTLQVTNTSSGVKTPAASRLPEPCQGLHLPAEA